MFDIIYTICMSVGLMVYLFWVCKESVLCLKHCVSSRDRIVAALEKLADK